MLLVPFIIIKYIFLLIIGKPSSQRRRERRTAARENSNDAEEASNPRETVHVPTLVTTDNDENAEEASRKNEVEKNDEKENECENNLEVETEEVSQEKVNMENSVANKMRDEKGKELENDEESCDTTNHDIVPTNTSSDEVPVYCTATVDNCPDSELNDDYYQSIRRFLVSEQHLVQNISSAELQFVSSRSSRNNLYTHTVSIVIYVGTARLWESAASYVRKHLGLTNYWTRSNGTVVKLSRIHQK